MSRVDRLRRTGLSGSLGRLISWRFVCDFQHEGDGGGDDGGDAPKLRRSARTGSLHVSGETWCFFGFWAVANSQHSTESGMTVGISLWAGERVG